MIRLREKNKPSNLDSCIEHLAHSFLLRPFHLVILSHTSIRNFQNKEKKKEIQKPKQQQQQPPVCVCVGISTCFSGILLLFQPYCFCFSKILTVTAAIVVVDVVVSTATADIVGKTYMDSSVRVYLFIIIGYCM